MTEKMCCRSCVSNAETVKLGCLGATIVDKKGAYEYASSFLAAFIESLGFKRILGERSDNERSLLSLIERGDEQLDGC